MGIGDLIMGSPMPIYEYRRPDGTTFDVIQSFSDDALTRDPETGVKVYRVLHAPAVHFKGSGFYNTDYGTRKRQREMASQQDASSSAESTKPSEKSTPEPGTATPSDGASSKASSESTSTQGAPKAPDAGASGDGAKRTTTADKSGKASKKSKVSGSRTKPVASSAK